ncbi:D-glycero-beta-D-manno-heptose 1,7-bisphosphate 7-phosphatase [Chromatiaceae bacterium AAb-1]|nr:D-glycero-beta-D-manno-heptose 1,7-bisphosphate 7-phosphatase [Chromatiaceae bacterium AAb-1]
MNKAVFLDRDGVINVDHAYVSKAENFEFIDGVFDACRYFQQQGYLLIVVTNQSGIGRGYYTEQDFQQLTDWMLAQFRAQGISISRVYFCPHHPQKALPPYNIDCNCRKPAPGMLLQAIREHQIDPAASIMLGDKAADMQAAAAAGIGRKILVLSGQALTAEDKTLADEVWPSIRLPQQHNTK